MELKTKNRRNHEKEKEVNLTLSKVNHTFLLLDLKLDPKPLDTHYTLRKNVFLNVKMGPIQDSICFNWSLGFRFVDPCLKWL